MLEWTLEALLREGALISPIVVPLPASVLSSPPEFLKHFEPHLQVIEGGSTRQESVLLGLRTLKKLGLDNPICLVHDAARPLVPPEDLKAMVEKIGSTHEGACLASPVRDTLKLGNDKSLIKKTVSRNNTWHALTPQGAHLDLLHDASEKAWSAGHPVTDDASILEFNGTTVHLVEGHPLNIKVTHPADWELFTRLKG